MMNLTNFAVPPYFIATVSCILYDLIQGCKKRVMLTIGLSLVTPEVMNNNKNPDPSPVYGEYYKTPMISPLLPPNNPIKVSP
jgi:hypothetical protein